MPCPATASALPLPGCHGQCPASALPCHGHALPMPWPVLGPMILMIPTCAHSHCRTRGSELTFFTLTHTHIRHSNYPHPSMLHEVNAYTEHEHARTLGLGLFLSLGRCDTGCALCSLGRVEDTGHGL